MTGYRWSRKRWVPEPEPETSAFKALLGLFDLERLDRDLFLGDPGPGEGRLFGGLVAAQSVLAASLTVEEGHLHSLHSYFLRPGRHDFPLRYVVDQIRNGRTFTTRRVVAMQGGEAIFNLSCSFTRPEEGISHQDPMPEAPPPEGLEDWETVRTRIAGMNTRWRDEAIELRICDPTDFQPGVASQKPRMQWMRPRGEVPDDPRIHTALVVYASDRTLLSTAGRRHGLVPGRMNFASLDHSLWCHHPPRFDDWMLYVTHSPAAHAARGLIFGSMYRADGTHMTSVAQEGLIRRPR
jgi:acyl-CoA thioesterase-2